MHAELSAGFAQDFSGTHTTNISGTSNRNSHNRVSRMRHSSCAQHPRFAPITRVVAPLAYADCAAAMVHQQKDRKGAVAARVLAELLGDALLQCYALEAVRPSLLIPVPLHWRREWQRGYNQSAILASHLGKRLGLPLVLNGVRRTRATLSQQQLDIADRAANMQGAFSVQKSSLTRKTIANQTVAIIDDVVTTGATAQALALALKQAGAAEIHLWSPTRAILKLTGTPLIQSTREPHSQ